MQRRRGALFLLFSLIASIVGTVMVPSVAGAATVLGGFEIDGNLADDPVAGIDWDTPAPATTFQDDSGGSDDSFQGSSKELNPGGWTCINSSVPQKDDILGGAIGFRTFEGKQWAYGNYTRKGVRGDAHIDYEFHQAPTNTAAGPGCPQLPRRTDGDILIAFDTTGGGANINVTAYQWKFNPGSTTTGTFTAIQTAGKFAGQANIPNTIPNHIAGDFGEAILNLTDTIGEIECGEFAGVYMKTRTATGKNDPTAVTSNAALADRTASKPLDLANCPNVTRSKSASPNPANVGQVVTYTITYTNTGNAPKTFPSIVDDYDQAHITVDDSTIDPAGTDNNDTITWTNITVPANGQVVLTYDGTVTGVFSGPTGETPCTTSQYRVLNKVTDSQGEFGGTLCVNASANVTRSKSASPNPADEGDVVTYTITYTNTGAVAKTFPSIVDDYDQAHITVDDSTIDPAGTDNNDTITWTNITVPAYGQVVLTYDGTVTGPFSGPKGETPCTTSQYRVLNKVTDSQGEFGGTLCVNPALPSLSVSKVRVPCPEGVVSGGQVTYTITYSNAGPGIARNAILTDTVTSGGVIVDGDGGTIAPDGKSVTWNLGDLASGAGGTKTITVHVTAPNGGSVNDTVTLTSNDGTASATPATVSTPVTVAGASTKGSAYGLDVRLLGAPLIDKLGAVSTEQPGGRAAAGATVVPVNLPGIVSAGIITTSSQSNLTNQATSTAIGQLANLNILNGVVTADLVKGVSQSTAGPFSASYNSIGSTFVNLTVGGQRITNVAPNGSAIIVRDLLGFPLAAVYLYESTGSSSNSAASVNTANGSVNMIRVEVLGGVNAGVSVVVSHADSEARYPSGEPCGSTAATVSGRAFTALVKTLLQSSTIVGEAVLPATGGSATNGTRVNVPGVATTRTADNDTSGSLTPTPNASSSSAVEKVNVLNGLITADALQVSCASTTASGASTTFGFTFLGLKVGSTVFDPLIPVAPNTVIALPQPDGSLVMVVLNERVSGGDGVNNTEGTINAIHVMVLRGTALETEVVVSSAHCDAHRAVPAP